MSETLLPSIATASNKAMALIQTAMAWDNHLCLPLKYTADRSGQRVLCYATLDRFRASGFAIVSVNVGCGDMSPEDHIRALGRYRSWISERPEAYSLDASTDGIVAAKATGRLTVLFDIEGAGAIGGELELVQLYYDLGVRWMLLCYNQENAAGFGCHVEDHGLTEFGRSLVREMERVGMLVCCSHAGPRTARDIMAYAKRPVLFSHSNPSALWDHPRNIDDAAIRACAATGGVIGINGIGILLGANLADSETVVRHIDYVASLVGPEHVGLGLDYVADMSEANDYVRANPDKFPAAYGYTDGIRIVAPEQLPAIVEGLILRGYEDSAVLGILGGNLMRVARQVWQ
jgi:membrane dipeptidase